MKATSIIIMALISCLALSTAMAATAVHDGAVMKPGKTAISPVIDGVIENTIWKETIVDGDLVSTQPQFGETLAQKTDIYMTYDEENIYFAFHCHDSEPGSIKTSISKRDGMFSDDFIAVVFDTLGNSQRAYIFCVNPSGIQGDLLVNSDNEDDSADWIWESAAVLDDTGYTVEIRLPLSSIQYASNSEKPMRIGFVRKIQRSNTMGSWPEMQPSDNFLTMQAPIVLDNLNTVRKLEVLPSMTYGNSSARTGVNAWDRDIASDMGGDISYSLSSSVTLDATINPDFSQVEADAFQVNVNRRYPIFYNEKRPFFMEVNSLYNVAGTGGGNNMRTAVHTRRIADPAWSSKLSGTTGKTLFGLLAAEDAWNNPDAVYMANPRYLIARAKRSLGDGSYIGAIYTGRNVGADNNHVAGFDGVYRFSGNHQFEYSMLQSVSTVTGSDGAMGGNTAMLNYRYQTKSMYVGMTAENMTDDFRMDTSFIKRTGITRAATYISPKIYPSAKRLAWIDRISPSFGLDFIRDNNMQADDISADIGINANLAKNGYFQISGRKVRENWADRAFDLSWYSTNGNVRPVKWLKLGASAGFGTGIYYSDDPFRGESVSYGANIDFEPGERFTQSIGFNHAEMTNPSTSEMMYDVDVVNTRSTYQFNKYFFVRGIYQYNTVNSRQLVDLLASFTFIPGTVVQLGYGTLMEEGRWDQDEWRNDFGDLQTMKKSLFFKTSYRHVF